MIAAALVVVLVLTGLVVVLVNSPIAGVHARLDVGNADHVRINEPVTVRFDQPVDLARTRVSLDLVAGYEVTKKSDRLIVRPLSGWTADKRYTMLLTDVPNSSHSFTLHGWKATFTTRPKVALAGVLVDGKLAPDPSNVTMAQNTKVGLQFTTAMKTGTVTINVNGQPLAADHLQWASNQESVTLVGLNALPYQPLAITVAPGAYSAQSDPLTDAAAATVTPQALVPSNPTSGIGPGFQTVPPIMVVVENSGPSRPQVGLQDADIVYEYISEYSISRMTAIYFNQPPGLIGPVRSCRMINPYLGFAFGGETMCSGASVGTLHYMFYDPILVPGSISDFDRGNHFFRVDFKAAPHNLYTNGSRGARLRDEWHLPDPPYTVDPPHADADFGQAGGDSVSVPLHAVGWSYDGGSKQYLRTDHGTAFTDDQYHAQLHAKNVVVVKTPFHDAGWVEDDNGGAHSIWYDMTGSGPADVYSNGKVVHGTWHMGSPGWFYDNHQPMWFTDEQGKVLELNSGLTWIHVIGAGQNS